MIYHGQQSVSSYCWLQLLRHRLLLGTFLPRFFQTVARRLPLISSTSRRSQRHLHHSSSILPSRQADSINVSLKSSLPQSEFPTSSYLASPSIPTVHGALRQPSFSIVAPAFHYQRSPCRIPHPTPALMTMLRPSHPNTLQSTTLRTHPAIQLTTPIPATLTLCTPAPKLLAPFSLHDADPQ